MWNPSLCRVSVRTLAKATASLLRQRFSYRDHLNGLLCTRYSFLHSDLAMANVTRSNFKGALQELQTLVKDAHFIAIDLEMSGITSAPWRENFEFDTLSVRYSKLKDSAEKFAVLQFGVCPFCWDTAKNQFSAHPYNFYIFPRNELPVHFPSFDFLCQTTSIEFLAKHQFDFNVCIYEGISYLSKQQEFEVRLKLGLTDVESKSHDSGRCTKHYKDIPLTSISDVLFSERMKNKFGEWRDNLLKLNIGQHAVVGGIADCFKHLCGSEINFVKKRPYLLLDELNSHQTILVEQVLRRHFKDLVYLETVDISPAIQKRVVYTHSEEDRQLLMKELDEERYMSLGSEVEQAVGFRHVVDLISSAGKVIVGHNCLLDFAHIHSKFIAPLPETVVEFAESLHKHFPYIIDTKYLLRTEPTLQKMMKNKSTSLSDAFTRMCGQTVCTSDALNFFTSSTVKVVIPTELERYKDAHGSAKHEAGYDAYMTGCIFAQACNYMNIDFNKIELGSDLAIVDKVQKHANLVFLGWIKSIVLDLTTGADATESRSMIQHHKISKFLPPKLVLVWGFENGYTCSNLRGLVLRVLGSASSVSGIFFLDAGSAFINFSNEQEATEFCCLMQDKMAESCNSLSLQSPVASLLEAGGINAVGYDMYEQICKSSLSKLLFAEQAEALGIKWKISASLEANKNLVKNDNYQTKSSENPLRGSKISRNPRGHKRIDGAKYFSEDKFLDTICASLNASAKRSRTES